MQKRQHPREANNSTDRKHSGKVTEKPRKVFSQRWAHTGAWETEALETRWSGRELDPVVDGEGQWSQQLYRSSIEISKSRIHQKVHRRMDPQHSRGCKAHWNGQDLQVL